MSRNLPKRPVSMVAERRFNPLVQALWITFIAIVAYFVAAFLHYVLHAISAAPSGPMWDAALQGPLFYILMIVVVGAFFVPIFHSEWDPALRIFSAFVVVFLIAYTVLLNTGIIDVDAPLRYLSVHVIGPFRRSIGF